MAVAARLPQLSTEDQISTEDQTAIPELLVDTTGHSGRERFIDHQVAITTLEEATPPARATFSSTGHPTAHRNLSSIDHGASRMAVAARLTQLSTEDKTAIPQLLVDTTGHSGRERFIDHQVAIT